MATAYQSFTLAPVIYIVQFDATIVVPLGKDAGGHTLAHSFVPLAKRHRTLSLSLSVVGIVKAVWTPTGIYIGEVIVATGGEFILPVSDRTRRSIGHDILQA